MGGECVEVFAERGLDVDEGFHRREAGAEDVRTADGAGCVLATFAIALVVVTEFLAAQGGRAAEGAVRLGEVANAEGHGCLLKTG